MAVLISTLQLLFLGALISPVYLLDACELIQNTTHLGSFNLSVIPDDYKADTNYSVTISGATNNSSVILQAIDSQNSSVGQWENPVVNCSNGLSGQQNITNTATIQWKSPNNVTDRVEIRVFVTFSDGSTLLQKTTLSREGIHFDCVTQFEDRASEDLPSKANNLQVVPGVGKGPHSSSRVCSRVTVREEETILELLDHKNLDQDVPHFADVVSYVTVTSLAANENNPLPYCIRLARTAAVLQTPFLATVHSERRWLSCSFKGNNI
ncbi:hypothetical protein UY3_07712 [Chelonia mydas]|uniref:Placenta-expressed transcript 1 protein n=1 Tax=Chelonia mydas TaxID=8469 RepID=M7C3V2_CHEMY|nr:hypothetical protein UY3_07712 [Chelonia mydas]